MNNLRRLIKMCVWTAIYCIICVNCDKNKNMSILNLLVGNKQFLAYLSAYVDTYYIIYLVDEVV